MKVQLSLAACNLEASDYHAAVTLNATDDETKDTPLGKTEVVSSTTSPKWTKVFVFDYKEGSARRIAIDIYGALNTWVGNRTFVVGKVMEQTCHVVAKKMTRGGIIIAHVVECSTSGTLQLKLKGHKLKNTEGLGILNKSDPFFVLQGKANNESWEDIYRSEEKHNNLSPLWNQTDIELMKICSGDLGAPIRGVVYNYKRDGKHELMGYFVTNVTELLGKESNDNEAIVLRKDDKDVGKIMVLGASLVGYKDPRGEATKVIEAAGKAEALRVEAEEKIAKAEKAALEAKEAQEAVEKAKLVAEDKSKQAKIAAEEAEAAKQAAEEAKAAIVV